MPCQTQASSFSCELYSHPWVVFSSLAVKYETVSYLQTWWFFCRILLMCIAFLSCYSIHLLLCSAGVVGEYSSEEHCASGVEFFTFLCKMKEWVHMSCDWFSLCLLVSVVWLGIRAYEQLGVRAFGHPGKIMAALIITLHNIGGKTLVKH